MKKIFFLTFFLAWIGNLWAFELRMPVSDDVALWISQAQGALKKAADIKKALEEERERRGIDSFKYDELQKSYFNTLEIGFKNLHERILKMFKFPEDFFETVVSSSKKGEYVSTKLALLQMQKEYMKQCAWLLQTAYEEKTKEFFSQHEEELDKDEFIDKVYPYLFTTEAFRFFDVVAKEKIKTNPLKAIQLMEEAMAFSMGFENLTKEQKEAFFTRLNRLRQEKMQIYKLDKKSEAWVNLLLKEVSMKTSSWERRYYYHESSQSLMIGNKVFYFYSNGETLHLYVMEPASGTIFHESEIANAAENKYPAFRMSDYESTLILHEEEVYLMIPEGLFIFDIEGKLKRSTQDKNEYSQVLAKANTQKPEMKTVEINSEVVLSKIEANFNDKEAKESKFKLLSLQMLEYLPSSERVLKLLGSALNDGNVVIAQTAIHTLGQLGSPEALDILKGKFHELSTTLKHTYNDTDNAKLSQTIEVLEKHKIIDEEMLLKLEEVFPVSSGPLPSLIIKTLGNSKSPKVIPILKRMLEKKDKGAYKDNIVEALGRTGCVEAIPVLSDVCLKREEILDLKRNAFYALSKIDSPEIISTMKVGLSSEDKSTKMLAIQMMGKYKVSESVPELEKALQMYPGEDDEKFRQMTILSLGEIGTKEAAIALKAAFNDKKTEIKALAVQQLGKMTCPEAVSILAQVLENQDSSIQRLAVEQMAKTSATQEILKLLESSDWLKRAAAVEMAGNMKLKEAVPVLSRMFKDADDELKSLIIVALGDIGEKSALPILEDALKSDDWVIQKTASEALKKINSQN